MSMRILLTGLAAMLLAAAGTAQAQARREPRELTVPANAAWQHARTQMILPSRVDGLPRTRLVDSSEDEQDVVATYVDREQSVVALVYIYSSMAPDAPLWFDRALTTILEPQAGVAPPPITAFARPGASAPTGLRAALTDNVPGMESTAIAVVPLGEWLVKIRLGSSRLDPAALDARLSAFIAGLRWPAESGRVRAALPIAACERPLRLRRARMIATTMEDTLISAVTSGPMQREARQDRPAPVYCRDPGATAAHGVYRADGNNRAYLIALSDSGALLSVGPTINMAALLGGSSAPRYGVTLHSGNSASVLPAFDRLPPPDQALATLGRGGPVLSVTTGNQ